MQSGLVICMCMRYMLVCKNMGDHYRCEQRSEVIDGADDAICECSELFCLCLYIDTYMEHP